MKTRLDKSIRSKMKGDMVMIEIRDDKLIRQTPVYSNGSCIPVQNTVVITKEEFLACFNEWVLKPMQGNPVSMPEFYVLVDNNGVTPV